MRVFHLIPSLSGGGAERQLAYLAGGLVGRGLDIHVGYIQAGVNLPYLESSGVTLHKLTASGNHDPGLFIRIRRLINTLKPDLVQTWLRQMDILGGAAAVWSDVPWIMNERSSSKCYEPNLKDRMRKWLAQRADGIIANSESGKKFWGARLQSPVPVFVVRNGFPLNLMSSVASIPRTESGIENEEALILFAGRFASERNLLNLLDGLAPVLKSRPAKAVLCGEGPLRADVESRLRALNIVDLVQLPGFIPELKLWQWMKRADVFVSVSLFEGNPNAVLEAIACKCPILVSDIAEHREILDETSAVFADPSNVSSITEGLNTILKNRAAADLRADAARIKCGILSIDEMAAQYENVYRTILNSSAKH